MRQCPDYTHLLVLPHLRIQNANAISSPLTHGFPALTAFTGLMWALERKARRHGLELAFKAVGVVCHQHQEQVSDGYVKAFVLSRNPVGKDGKTAAIVEEGRIHLELSLVLAVHSEHWRRNPDRRQPDSECIAELLAAMRVAGGTPLPAPGSRRYQPYVLDMTGAEKDREAEFRKARLRLLPGFSLVARDDLLDKRFIALQEEDPSATRLDAWLSLARINWRYRPAANEEGEETATRWVHDREAIGWVVPIPVGYGALTDLHAPGTVANARDATTPFRFVESLYSVGEWVSPHRLSSPEQMLWYADSRPEEGLYRLRNDYCSTSSDETHFE